MKSNFGPGYEEFDVDELVPRRLQIRTKMRAPGRVPLRPPVEDEPSCCPAADPEEGAK